MNIQNEDGETPLHWACYENHEEIISVLLRAGADPKIVDKEDCSPADLGADQIEENEGLLLSFFLFYY